MPPGGVARSTANRDGVWSTGDVKEAWGLRVELPVRVDQNLTSLEVTVGPQCTAAIGMRRPLAGS